MPGSEPSSTATRSHTHPSGAAQFATAANVFSLLSDPTRLHLVWSLARGEADVNTLTEASGAARPAVSQHLAKLRLAGLVQVRKEGRRSVYSLHDGHLRRLVTEAVNHADHMVTGAPSHD
ncbi:metalloregulator ArsR/SmtB family transcription factor [Streptomyces sp. MK37H]|uniref:ArsR/SmtB family transcription factor n=1 Tax=Streptomyces sp. MK37H TaxID=2699117 RepID=UPI001B36C600|nr:metalloregulator ArsR/SmtB family transcription factor [Streptomyces sp. MK37H]MBP8538693.1 metalloregulator ArsR/SmtB family transcription factor [Streptomyces sp. MK37H]